MFEIGGTEEILAKIVAFLRGDAVELLIGIDAPRLHREIGNGIGGGETLAIAVPQPGGRRRGVVQLGSRHGGGAAAAHNQTGGIPSKTGATPPQHVTTRAVSLTHSKGGAE